MKTLEYNTEDKSTWGEGAWQNEPDKKQWVDLASGFPCLIVRGPTGGLCGYVGVPKGHPWFNVPHDEVEADAHGGLSYSGFCQDTEEESVGVCHAVEPGEDDKAWWVGFDCIHAWDYMPNRTMLMPGTYRDFAYLTAEVEKLAKQAHEAKGLGCHR